MRDQRKTTVIGEEHDQVLRAAVLDALGSMSAENSKYEWGIGGSQEVETLEVTVDGEALVLEAEAYVGLSVSGPAELVDRLVALVRERVP